MSAESKGRKRYHSPERTERANRTKQAILEAAEAEFRARGYGAATMSAIATRVGVSVATVYLYFPTKPSLVREMSDQITSADELSVTRVLGELEPLEILRIGAGILRKLHERSEIVAEALRVAAGSDAEVNTEWVHWKEGHLFAVGQVARALHKVGALDPRLDIGTATDVLYAIGGADTFRQLVGERGWSPRRYERWLFEAGQRLLFPSAVSS